MEVEVLKRISLDPRVMVGKPVVRGTRIPVEMIVQMLAQGVSEDEILREYPRLRRDDVRACLTYAARVLANKEVLPQYTQSQSATSPPNCVDATRASRCAGRCENGNA